MKPVLIFITSLVILRSSFGQIPVTNLMLGISASSDGVAELELKWPYGFTNNLEIYSATSLVSNDWEVISSKLSTSGLSSMFWTNTSTNIAVFFRIGDADTDTDGDRFADARELIVTRTDIHLFDTDGDGLGDYDEVYLTGTDPLLEDSDRNGVPDGFELRIVIEEPFDAVFLTNSTVEISGYARFNGTLVSSNTDFRIWIDSEPGTFAETNGLNYSFSENIIFSEDGTNYIPVIVSCSLSTQRVEAVANVLVIGAAYPEEVAILSPLDGVEVESLNVHVEVLVEGDDPIWVNEVEAARDGYVCYAWVSLVPGTNTVVASSTNQFGQVGVDEIEVVCSVPDGTLWEPVNDLDMDGVLDVADPEPVNPSVSSGLYFIEPVNGKAVSLED